MLQIDENVQREIINHRSLRHPNIIRFKEVILTPTHLAIVMEYASGGELFERICNAGRFSEDEVSTFPSFFLINSASICSPKDLLCGSPRLICLSNLPPFRRVTSSSNSSQGSAIATPWY
jgi:hypothetical protein